MTTQVERLVPQEDLDLAHRLVELQRRSYAIEAEIIGDTRIPALREEVEDLRAKALSWLGIRDHEDCVVAAVGFSESTTDVDIDRLVVDPGHLRQGFGAKLTTAVLEQAGARPVTVSTGRANHPARALYERLGFVRLDDAEVLPGLWVTRYELTRKPTS